jgi:hypothetical protein
MAGILKRMRKKYKSTYYGGTWMKWFKRRVKGHNEEFEEFSENYLRALDKIEHNKKRAD